MTAGAMFLVETAGAFSSDAGRVLHFQPVGSHDPVELIVALITHPEEDFAVAQEIVAEAWHEWLDGDADRGDDFVYVRRRAGGQRGFERVLTVLGSADAVVAERGRQYDEADRVDLNGRVCDGYPHAHGSRSFLAIERHGS